MKNLLTYNFQGALRFFGRLYTVYEICVVWVCFGGIYLINLFSKKDK